MRTERANLTMTSEGKELMEKAAKARGMSLSVWLEEIGRKEAKKILALKAKAS